MKNYILTGALAIFTMSGFAQTQGQGNTPGNTQTGQSGQQDYLRTHSERMSTDLGLNQESQRRLSDLNTTHYGEQMRMRQSNTDQTKWKENDDKANKEYDKQLREILDDTQYRKYESSRNQYNFDYNRGTDNSNQQNRGTGTQQNRGSGTQPNNR